MSTNVVRGIMLTLAVTLCVVGCNSKTKTEPAKNGADKHAAPATYSEAVAELRELMNEIETNLTSGDKDAVDGPLHEVMEIGSQIGTLASDEGFDDTAIADITASTDSLLAAAEQIHDGAGMHDGDDAATDDEAVFEYATVKPQITSALNTLESHVGKGGDEDAPETE